ncbi:hypothetical protein KY358_07010, partial [Candidatus Woesearchaeota archaeon]|nr:hypothetical protein [Candidatus Woesearchaeota archaeon]
VEDWISKKGKEKEIKKKLEHVEPKGKNIEWFIEIWEDLNEYTRTVVRLRALFTDVKETKIMKGKSKKRVNKGNVLIVLDGILKTDLAAKWQQKPWFYFLRAITDKFIYKFYLNKFEDALAKDVFELHDELKDFFGSYQ